MKKVKSIYNGGALVSQYAKEFEPQSSQNEYVKCFHVDTSFFKTKTIRLSNLNEDAAVLTYKVIGFVDPSSISPVIITTGDLAANTATNLIDAATHLQYSKIELYVKSKVADTPANYIWEFFVTIH